MTRLIRHRWLDALLLMMVAVAGGVWPVAFAQDADRASQIREAVKEIVEEADKGKDVGMYITSTADLGIDAAIQCAREIDPAHPARNAGLLEVIALAGRTRRAHSELLRLYDPSAYRLFYSDSGLADQALIGKAADLNPWCPKTAEALVRAAPAPTIAWMTKQATLENPRIAELVQLWQTWGFWVRVGHERQYAPQLCEVVGRLAGNQAILGNADARAALLRFAGEIKAVQASAFIFDSLAHGQPAARAEAAGACGRIATDEAGAAIVAAAAIEDSTAVQQKIASASERWPDRADMGKAMVALFNRTNSAATRREILFSCSKANWAERTEILLRAFDVPEDGVLGAGFIALSVKPDPQVLARTLEVAKLTDDAQPPLIDTLGAYGDPRGMRHLIRWLSRQNNPVVKVKLLLALEKTSQHEADALFLQLLNGESSPMVVEQTIGIIARKQISGGEDALTALAVDATAPMQVRIEAIWAMGRFDTAEIRETLTKLDKDADTVFKGPVDQFGKPAAHETIDMARMMVALSKIQLHEPDGDAKLQAAFDQGTATAELTALIMLAQTHHDHPIISQGLNATDTAIILGAAKAALAIDPVKYHDQLVRLGKSPFMIALLQSGLDSANLRDVLRDAIQAGEKR